MERLLGAVRRRLEGPHEHAALRAAARDLVTRERERLAGGGAPRELGELADLMLSRIAGWLDPREAGPVPVINATGVLLHTNLGRAAWPRAAVEAAALAAAGQSLLEMERDSGRRGPRFRAAEDHLVALTGARDALVTNNNAAALVLAVGLAGRRGVAVSRGELAEIGGGVRIPEIVRRAGARLVEVGTTNRTRLADYAEVLASGRAALILRVHRSNFRLEGFTEEPDLGALADLAHGRGVPLVDDLGSGALLDTAAWGLAHEPTPSESLAAGADLVTFSGDKLIGGPQAGLLVGRADLVARMRRDPLARAMRPDKVTLAAVAATLGIYRAGRALLDVPVWRAISTPLAEIEARAGAAAAALASGGAPGRSGMGDALSRPGIAVEVVATRATVGGGSLPGETLPSAALRVAGVRAAQLAARLRAGDPCVVARIEDGAVILDLRSVPPERDEELVGALALALAGAPADAPGDALADALGAGSAYEGR